ncbi:alpha-amylase family glycosyl hydrolase [Maricaulis parjimensis]|uniref:alpha-amylase family glycosyl hydrolase n=1 Tax=Maricaulis parjimensis TaxID=144023 RepID=UPI00193A3B80|nr:alpha-amylase family glycosyl hydrolase [Maricaulis parjimensis]
MMKLRTLALASAACVLVTLPACAQSNANPAPDSLSVTHADWARDAVLYQINLRQFTPDGTITAAQDQLPRLAEMGVDILWLMPIQPIGEVNRKGTLGSPYSISDYTDVNPELGTLDDIRAFVDAAHDLGMEVILDWVANHSAWDNPLVEDHPDWYSRNWAGEMQPPPGTDWSDVVDFNYDNPDLRDYMAGAMEFWVREVGFDGFRCDVAGFVPLDFWERVRTDLEAIKPVFMLAEWEQRDLHRHAFDATYAWSWNNMMHDVALNDAGAGAVRGYYLYEDANAWPRDAYRLRYVANHDQNSWEATQFDRFGDALEAVIALSFTGTGIPMIYNGQEAGNMDQLEFFERDPIIWREHPIGDLYTRLIALRRDTPALHNGAAGAVMQPVSTSQDDQVFAFSRRDAESGVLAIFNWSAAPVTATLEDGPIAGLYRDFDTDDALELDTGSEVALGPWQARIFIALSD